MDEVVRRALAALFPGRETTAVEPASGSAHPDNRTVAVTFADGARAYLKAVVDGDGERVARAVAAARYARANCEVRVPEVLAAAPGGDPPAVATAPLAGTPAAEGWADATSGERAAAMGDLGCALAGTHVARFDEHGRVVGGDGRELELDTGPWTDVLVERIERWKRNLFPDRFAGAPERVVAALRDHRGRLDPAPAALLHEDPNRDNVLGHPDGPGLVDWERALVGDPALELCRAVELCVERPAVADRDRLRAALHEGYRDVAGSLPAGFRARRPLYRAVAFLVTPGTFHMWAPGAPEPNDELAEWVRAELDRRLPE